jgi:Zn-dependent protease with chaperone function
VLGVQGRRGYPSCAGHGSYQGKRCLICRGDGRCALCKRASGERTRAPLAAPPLQSSDPRANVDGGAAQPTRSSGGQPAHLPTAVGQGRLAANVPNPIATIEERVADILAAFISSAASAPLVELWPAWRVAIQSLAALGVLLFFYVFSIAVIVGLVAVSWLQLKVFADGGRVVLWLVVLPIVVALALVVAIWPRFPRWEDPERGLPEGLLPDLFAMLREVARATCQPMPRRVYLYRAANAFVANRGLFMGRAIGIGLPLFELLTVEELRSVVAHELGHYAGRGAGLGTLVYRAASTFASGTEAAGGVPGLGILFYAWTLLFLRVAMPIAQQQELRADELACGAVGADATISALAKLQVTVDDAGIFDPDAEHNARLFGTHPPLRDRVALARQFGKAPVIAPDRRPASVLAEPLLGARRA